VQDEVLNKYALGRFLHEIEEDMLAGLSVNQTPLSGRSDSVQSKNPAAKMLVYSGHDSTIYSLLLASHVFTIVGIRWTLFDPLIRIFCSHR
jgi:hypothetical protein